MSKRIAGLIVPVTAALVLSGCQGSGTPAVSVGTVGRSSVTAIVQAPATVVARASATVIAPATGTVVAVRVVSGERVTAGQVLMIISSPSAQLALTTARRAVAQLGTAQVNAPRISTSGAGQADRAAAQAFATARAAAAAIPDPTLRAQTMAQIAAAQAQYAAARSAAARAAAQLNAGLGSLSALATSLSDAQRAQADAALAGAQAAVDALTVKAPIGGTVVLGGASAASISSASSLLGQLPQAVQSQAASLIGSGAGGAAGSSSTGTVVAAGSPVAAGSVLATVNDLSALTLAAAVDETDVLSVKPGVRADVNFDALPDAQFAATVLSVDVNPSSTSQGGVSYLVRLGLGRGTNPDGSQAPAPRPGMTAVASLRVATAVDAVTVPVAAVITQGTQNSVWLVQSGIARLRPVTLGVQGDSSDQILRGLSVGDRIVVAGADQVTAGQRVGG